MFFVFLQAEDGILYLVRSRGLGDVYKRQGLVFVLDRDPGKPVWPVEERAVPQGGAEGEQLSPTQPFPTHVPALVPHRIAADDMFGLIPVSYTHLTLPTSDLV